MSTSISTLEFSQPWECVLCKKSGILVVPQRPSTTEEMKQVIDKFHQAHKAVSPDCPANTITDEEKRIGASILRYVILKESPQAGPSAEQIMRDMPMRMQLAILRRAIEKHFPPSDLHARFYKDMVLLMEQFDIRISKIDKFILSLTDTLTGPDSNKIVTPQ